MPASDVGTTFGKYSLLKKLAAGGMGEVFLARQQGPAGFEKIFIIKKVLAHLTANKEFVELFLSEARLAARMSHRNIVQVFELGEQDGSYFIAMEYVQGKTLRQVIDATLARKEKIPVELCRSAVGQICDGSSYAHNLADLGGRSLNIIHRDLNPQNVLVSYSGDVKVIDFGIAKSEMSTVQTEAGMIKGKFIYMSPEQSLAKKLDKRSDVFAIGITLYEMLTGINPFDKKNMVLTLEAVQRYHPPPVSEYDPCYAPFDPIIARALAKDRERRYPDAAEMQDDLRRIALPPSTERLGQFMRRLFREQLEEDEKSLAGTQLARASSPVTPATKTPARPMAARPATPARPAPGTPPQDGRPSGPADTLMDLEALVLPQTAAGHGPSRGGPKAPGGSPPAARREEPAGTRIDARGAAPAAPSAWRFRRQAAAGSGGRRLWIAVAAGSVAAVVALAIALALSGDGGEPPPRVSAPTPVTAAQQLEEQKASGQPNPPEAKALPPEARATPAPAGPPPAEAAHRGRGARKKAAAAIPVAPPPDGPAPWAWKAAPRALLAPPAEKAPVPLKKAAVVAVPAGAR